MPLAADDRRARGAWYTPGWLAQALVAEALRHVDGPVRSVLDPACGDGALLACAPAGARAEGWDLDPGALTAARARLGDDPALVARDTLTEPAGTAFDLVVGNPPFRTPLRARTARDHARRAALRARFGPAAARYADDAGLFLLAALEAVRPGGVVAFVLPRTLLAAADARPLRDRVLAAADIVALWHDDGQDAFEDAAVRTCVVVLRRRGAAAVAAPVRRFAGPAWKPLADAPPASALRGRATWSTLLADGPPVPSAFVGPPLGGRARVTADFREHFYAVAAHARPADDLGPDAHPVLTARHVDPAHCRWAGTAVRIGGRTVQRPALTAAAMTADPHLARWAPGRLAPKVVVATQTAVLECVVDAAGTAVPLTPLVSVLPEPPLTPAAVAALLGAPVTSLWAHHEAAGSGMSHAALRVSARLLREVPLPSDVGALAAAGDAFAAAQSAEPGERHALLARSGALVHAAFGLPEAADRDVTAWWADRLPPPR